MKVQSAGELALVRLLNEIDDGLGDSVRLMDKHVEGGRFFPGDDRSGVAEMALGYELYPNCRLDEDGYPEEGQDKVFSHIKIRLEIREVGVGSGDEIIVSVPRNWLEPIDNGDEARLADWFERTSAVHGVGYN